MILFDFDGVLVDSIKELALTGYNLKTGSKFVSLAQLPQDYLHLFLFNQHLTLGAGHTCYLSRWVIETLEKGESKETYLDREAFLANHYKAGNKELVSAFYSMREWLMDNHLNNWIEINRPFESIWAAAQKLDSNEYFILTNKNQSAVRKICDYYELGVPTERIYSGEKGQTKSENILIIDDLIGSKGSYIFLDDALENLQILPPVLPGRIKPVLADWGCSSREDRTSAQAQGIEIVSQEVFISTYLPDE
jgi:phosphoglycolate phosphatase-like HAD superfamily hydrolase